MSRVGKKPVIVAAGATAEVRGQLVSVKGAKGTRTFLVPDDLSVSLGNGEIAVTPRSDNKRARALWGTARARIANVVEGVTKGFSKKLEITGVGYRAAVQGKVLKLSLGYSHDVEYPIPDDLGVVTPKPTEIEISGNDEQRVGQAAAEIRDWRRPEPYKGKGVRYSGEFIFRKEGKKKK